MLANCDWPGRQAAAWPEDRPLAHWQREGRPGLRARRRWAPSTARCSTTAPRWPRSATRCTPRRTRRRPKAPVLYIKPRNTFCRPRRCDRRAGRRRRTGDRRHARHRHRPHGLPRERGRRAGAAWPATPCATTSACRTHRYYRPSLRFKCRDGFCPIGPWVVAARHVADPDALAVRGRDRRRDWCSSTSTAGMHARRWRS